MKLLTNCKIYSMNTRNDTYKAVVIDGSKIIEVIPENKQIDYKNMEVIDLKGSYLFPGFTDSHTHSFEGGLYSMGANLSKAKSISEVLELIDNSSKIGNYKFAFSFDENSIKENRFPTIKELDKVCPNTPLLLRRVDGHSCVVNTAALEIIKFDSKLSSDFNGLLKKENNDVAAHTFHNTLTEEAILRSYRASNDIALTNGLTCVHTMIGDAQFKFNHYPLIQQNLHNFTIDFELYPQFLDIDKALSINSKRIGGCILADGSFGSYTAALNSPYENTTNIGTLYQTDEFWNDFVLKAHTNDLQVGVHCIGDRAIAQVVSAYVKAQQANPKDLRHQIIHNELMSDKSLALMAEYNISAVMQPMFDKLWGGTEGFYNKVLGNERALGTNRLKTIYEKNILLAGSSDWYITTLNILEQLDAACTIHNSNESLTVDQALRMYTINSAKLDHSEKTKGTIEIGKQADFTILNKDPYTENSFKNNKILGVIKSGELILV